MLKVRRSLTEILLEVTNEEISSVCREVWSRARAKGTPDTPDRTNRSIFRTFAYLSTEIINSFCYQFLWRTIHATLYINQRALKTVFPFVVIQLFNVFRNICPAFFYCVFRTHVLRNYLLHESLKKTNYLDISFSR